MTNTSDDIVERYCDANRQRFMSQLCPNTPKSANMRTQMLQHEVDRQAVELQQKDMTIRQLRAQILKNEADLREKRQLQRENERLKAEIEELRRFDKPFDFEVPENARISTDIARLRLNDEEYQKFYDGLKRVEEETIAVNKRLNILEGLLAAKDGELAKLLHYDTAADQLKKNQMHSNKTSTYIYDPLQVSQEQINSQRIQFHSVNETLQAAHKRSKTK